MKKISKLFETVSPKANISYTAFVLSEKEHNRLLEFLYKNTDLKEMTSGWEMIAHHSTICMGEFKKDRKLLKSRFDLKVKSFCFDDNVCAVAVEWPFEIDFVSSSTPHITIAVNRKAGAKPVQSNRLNWSKAEKLPEFIVSTTFLEVPQGETGFAGQF